MVVRTMSWLHSEAMHCAGQGLPPGWTQACYPVLPPGVTSHRNLPRRVDDGERLEVLPNPRKDCPI